MLLLCDRETGRRGDVSVEVYAIDLTETNLRRDGIDETTFFLDEDVFVRA